MAAVLAVAAPLGLAGFPLPTGAEVFAGKPSPAVTADAAILVDARTGEILYSKDIHKKEYPASTTKIMTALLALENLELNEIVTVDDKSPYTKGSKIALNPGEEVSVEELLYCTLIPSANDAAEALAVRVSGSLESFAALMNKRAKELGAQDTHFVNPSGLESEEHVTSAFDLAMFARAAMKDERFRHFVSTYSYTMAPTNKQPQERLMHNTNRLLYDGTHKVTYEGAPRPIKYEGVTGIKTGYTAQAGYCLVAGARRDGTELIAVLMRSASDNARYLDAISLLEYGFSNYRTTLGVAAGTTAGALGADSGDGSGTTGAALGVEAYVAEDVWLTLPLDASQADLEREVDLPPLETAVDKGAKVGVMTLKYQGVALAQADLLASEAAEPVGGVGGGSLGRTVLTVARNVFLVLLALFVLLVFAYVMLKRRQLRLKRMRRAERKARMEREARDLRDLRR
ncbi:MAG: D-alanyl-D-alanine carboxypeptidase [Clostridiales Family XIII bacterium]|nr:D-alanyl-D-alanine carboxypeptidase [Clostridiales Family XIII bacterium]